MDGQTQTNMPLNFSEVWGKKNRMNVVFFQNIILKFHFYNNFMCMTLTILSVSLLAPS